MTRRKETKIRNVGIIAHVDAGKTTLTERLLHGAGAVHRVGSVDGGTTATDFDPIERRKGITINSAAVHFEHREHGINLIDTPGHADFTLEVERSLRVLDGAIVLVDAVAGVQPQTEKVWRQADRYGVARIAFVNKLDRVGADLDRAVASLETRFGARPVVIGYPVFGNNGATWVDLLAASAPEGVDADVFAQRRARLIEACADVSSEVEAAFVYDQPVDRATLADAVRAAVADGRFLPVLAGSAAKDIGVDAVLDAVVDYLPPPKVHANAEHGRLAFCFKVAFEKFGALAFVRVYRGELARGDMLWSSRAGRTVRVGRLVRLFGDRLDDVERLPAGAIGAVVGGSLETGDTLSESSVRAMLEGVEKPEAVVHLAIEPARAADRERLHTHLTRMLIEDPSLVRRQDPETHEEVLGGVGQLHLEVVLERLRTRSGVALRAGRPKVALRSTIGRAVDQAHRHVKRSGGPGQFAALTLRVEPAPTGNGVTLPMRREAGRCPRNMCRGSKKACGKRWPAARSTVTRSSTST